MLAKALASAASAQKAYVEDVFSTYLYTGNGSTQTITNGIDLSGKGGLVWIKGRDGSAPDHMLYDTARGIYQTLNTNSTGGEISRATSLTSFNSTGFNLGSYIYVNGNSPPTFPSIYASWTFRKAAKFFDVVTWTGDGVAGRTVAHNLGSVPGCIIVKQTDTTSNWAVYHRSPGATQFLLLNLTNAVGTSGTTWNNTEPTSSVFTLGANAVVNASGGTYIAYLFAHDAGGFGDSGNDSVVKCGSFNDPGTGVTVDLGWEPQWVLLKRTNSTGGNWRIIDNMRGWPMYAQASRQLFPNTSGAEDASEAWGNPTPTGFFANAAATGDYIYIAIRRGPMKTPTDATKVFSANISSGSSTTEITTNFPVDLATYNLRGGAGANTAFVDRLRGLAVNSSSTSSTLISSSTVAEAGYNIGYEFWNTSFKIGSYYGGNSNVFYSFRRAPGFFDVVAYTGGVTNQAVNHNLGVTPEFIIVKARNVSGQDWNCYHSFLTANNFIRLNTNQDYSTSGSLAWNSTEPTSTQFYLGTNAWGGTNFSGTNYIAYLFATLSGVSKVGSYTGTGTTLSVDCGFTAGARLVLIKRTDSTGNWYIWDSARGIVSGNDPYLLLNSTAAEVTNTDYIDPLSSGFQISSTAPAEINASGGSYIFLAVA